MNNWISLDKTLIYLSTNQVWKIKTSWTRLALTSFHPLTFQNVLPWLWFLIVVQICLWAVTDVWTHSLQTAQSAEPAQSKCGARPRISALIHPRVTLKPEIRFYSIRKSCQAEEEDDHVRQHQVRKTQNILVCSVLPVFTCVFTCLCSSGRIQMIQFGYQWRICGADDVMEAKHRKDSTKMGLTFCEMKQEPS